MTPTTVLGKFFRAGVRLEASLAFGSLVSGRVVDTLFEASCNAIKCLEYFTLILDSLPLLPL